MTERGKVREIRDGLVIIAPDRSASCFGCMNMECKSAGFLSAENPHALPIEPGQMVELHVPGRSLLAQALAAFLPPALGFAAGYALTSLLFPQAAEGAASGMGLIFLFLAAFIAYKARKKSKAVRGFAVTRIIAQAPSTMCHLNVI